MAKIEICSNPAGMPPRCECISVPKIFDQCRLQVCLTPTTLGPAKIDTSPNGCCRNGCKNEKVVPPASAASVTTEHFCIKNIAIINKTPCSFKNGYYDVTIKFTFSYCLVFYNNDSDEVARVPACNSYTAKVSLYGGEDLCVAALNELYGRLMSNGPFTSVEASAMPLATELVYPKFNCGCGWGCNCNCSPDADSTSVCCSNGVNNGTNGCCEHNCNQISPIAVDMTIGLFAVVKLLRISNISVHSQGNCTPCECSNVSPDIDDPCGFFENLQFPTGLFAPQTGYKPCTCEGTADVPTGNGKCCDKNC